MKTNMITRMTILLLSLLLSAVVAFGATATGSRSFDVYQHGKLQLNLPKSWKQEIRQSGDLPPTITLTPVKGKDFKVMITPVWNQKGEAGFNKAEAVKFLINTDLKEMLPTAVEKDVALKELKGLENTGYYFQLTDKSPKPGEYKYAVRAGLGVGDLLLSVTVLSKTKESAAVSATLKALQEARQVK